MDDEEFLGEQGGGIEVSFLDDMFDKKHDDIHTTQLLVLRGPCGLLLQ